MKRLVPSSTGNLKWAAVCFSQTRPVKKDFSVTNKLTALK
jgi:hypothetical protein